MRLCAESAAAGKGVTASAGGRASGWKYAVRAQPNSNSVANSGPPRSHIVTQEGRGKDVKRKDNRISKIKRVGGVEVSIY